MNKGEALLLFALNLVTLLVQIQFSTASTSEFSMLLFALNLVTLLVQIQLNSTSSGLSLGCYLL